MNYILNPLPEPIAEAQLQRLARAETATIGHFRLLGFADPAIKPLRPGRRVAGTAVTLVLPGLDSTLLHYVAGQLRPGDFLIIDRLGERRHSCLGGGIGYALQQRGVLGAVIDGPCNDPQELLDYGFPVWSRGISPVTTRLLNSGGAFNVPINCGGAVVLPGYAVLADDNGVVVLPPQEISADSDRAVAMQEQEQQFLPTLSPVKGIGDISGATKMVESALAQAKQ